MNSKSVLKLSIAVALGIAGGNAAATVDLTGAAGTTKSASIFVKEMPTATASLSNALPAGGGLATGTLNTPNGPLSFKIPLVPGYSVSAANVYFVKIALTGKATFGAQPTLYCGAIANGSAVAAGVAGSVTVGGVATNAVTFSLPAMTDPATAYLSTSANATGCVVSIPSVGISGGLSDVGISGTVEYKDGVKDATLTISGPFITFKKTLSASVSTLATDAGTTATDAIIDVTTGSKMLASGSLYSTAVAAVGSISYTQIPQATTASYNSGGSAFTSGVEYVSGSTGFSVTIAGPAVGNATTAYLTTGTEACKAANLVYSVTPSAASVTIGGIVAGDISAGLSVCLGFPKTTTISEGQITATLKNSSETNSGTNSDLSVASNNLYKLTKNGTSFGINFLTNPAGFGTFVRFTNPTSFDGNISVTAINDDGAVGPNTWTFVLPKGASQMYSVTSIVAKTGVVTATTVPADGIVGNKFRLMINADLSSLKAQALNLSKDGNSFGQLVDIDK